MKPIEVVLSDQQAAVIVPFMMGLNDARSAMERAQREYDAALHGMAAGMGYPPDRAIGTSRRPDGVTVLSLRPEARAARAASARLWSREPTS